MNVLIAPDSFKGTLTAMQAAQAMAAGVQRALPDASLRLQPMADGGEGTLDVVLSALPGERRNYLVTGAEGQPVHAEYAVITLDGEPAGLIEIARVVGAGLLQGMPLAVAQRSTQGVGALLRHGMDTGLRHFVIGLGGSSTNDGGAGLLAALGVVLYDANGQMLEPSLCGLADLARLDFSMLDARLAQCRIQVLADVQNPLCGRQGATAVYGPQKGVAENEIPVFDARLQHLAELGDAWAGHAVSLLPGTGAAGGLGYALQLLGAKSCSGAEYLVQLLGIDRTLKNTDLLITGEGRSDEQTLQGKLPFILAERAHRAGVPAVLVSGGITDSSRRALGRLFSLCVAVQDLFPGLSALEQAAYCLEQACFHTACDLMSHP